MREEGRKDKGGRKLRRKGRKVGCGWRVKEGVKDNNDGGNATDLCGV